MNPAIRVVRTMQIAFIVSICLFFYVSRIIQPQAQSVNSSFQGAIVLCAIASAMAGFIGQRLMARAPNSTSPVNQNSTPRARWLAGHVVRFATAESVALFGIVLRQLGGPSNIVYILFGGSLVLLLLWQPGTVPAETESKTL